MAISERRVLDVLRPIQDPDLRRSIVDLGFIKNVKIKRGKVAFDLVLTTPACPVRDQLKEACETYVNENELGDQVINVSEAIYAWAREEAGVSRAFVTVWFRYPHGQRNPPRRDTFRRSQSAK